MLLQKALGRGGLTSIPRCLQYRCVQSKIWCPYATSSKKRRPSREKKITILIYYTVEIV